jgi:hypothetical protein
MGMYRSDTMHHQTACCDACYSTEYKPMLRPPATNLAHSVSQADDALGHVIGGGSLATNDAHTGHSLQPEVATYIEHPMSSTSTGGNDTKQDICSSCDIYARLLAAGLPTQYQL